MLDFITPILYMISSFFATIGIWYGILSMIRANRRRGRILDRQQEADERRHKESMAAHDESMATHRETMKALDIQRKGIEALIRRA